MFAGIFNFFVFSLFLVLFKEKLFFLSMELIGVTSKLQIIL